MKENTRIKKLRTELGLSQNTIAKELDVSKQYFSRVEKGETSLSKEKAIQLANLYKISLDWLLLGIGEMFLTNAKPIEKKPEPVIKENVPTNETGTKSDNKSAEKLYSYIKEGFSSIEKEHPKATTEHKLAAVKAIFEEDIMPLSVEDTAALIKNKSDFSEKMINSYYKEYMKKFD